MASAQWAEPLQKLTAVGREGQGNEAASAAWNTIVSGGPAALLPVLQASGEGGPVADNWLRLAAGTIADRALSQKQALPIDAVVAFLKDTSHRATGRALAFDILRQIDPALADKTEAELVEDPIQELRRGGVRKLIAAAHELGAAGKKVESRAQYHQALNVARDEDQVNAIASALEQAGEKVDLAEQFGFLKKWWIVGPFDNLKRTGFDIPYPPESSVKLETEYQGKPDSQGNPRSFKWASFESQQTYGMVDINKPLGMLKETTAYAYTNFHSAEDREVEIRLGCKNAWKVWVNGEFIFGRDEYHRGMQMDQYKLHCHFKKGANAILVKCCQNEQTETWTVEWQFQLRVCDSAGTAIREASKM